MKFSIRLSYSALSEYVFVVLPIVIVMLVNAFKADDYVVKTFFSPEFGVASVMVIGQTLVKFAGSIHSIGRLLNKNKLVFVISIFIALQILSVFFLTIVLSVQVVPAWVYFGQIVSFILASGMHFVVVGLTEEIELFEKEQMKSKHPSK